MSTRSYTKRNRPVTACRECHRRKQKCDRLKPCNMCLIRNVPEKCLYGDEMQKLVNAVRHKEPTAPLTPSTDHESSPEHEAVQQPAISLEEQIGYSALSDNAFIDLYKSLDDIHIPTAGSLGLSTCPLKSHIKERYFRIVAQLPSVAVCQLLVDTYFSEANWYFVALDRYFFDRLRAAWIASALPDETSIRLEQYPTDLQHLPALLYQVMAIGLQFSPANSDIYTLLNLKDHTAAEKLSQTYSDLGRDIMDVLGRQNPSITGIEHDIMRMTWLKNVSRGTESRHSIGSAVSQAQDLELHLDVGLSQTADDIIHTPEQLWYDEYRRRVWTRVFLLDSHMALVLGRPRHIHIDDCTAPLPTNCDIPDSPTSTRPSEPGPGEPPSSFSYVIYLYEIAVKIHEVMSAKHKKAQQNDYRKVEKTHRDIEAILESLPPALRPQTPDTSWDLQRPYFPMTRQQILSSANSFLMKLHRPYISIHENSRNAVIRAALGTLDAQQALFNSLLDSPNQHRIYGFSFYTIDAAILLTAVVVKQMPDNVDMIRHVDRALRQAIARLRLLKDTSAVAASGEHLLTQCYVKIASIDPVFMQVISSGPEVDLQAFDQSLVEEELDFLNDYSLPDRQQFELGVSADSFDPAQYLLNNQPLPLFNTTRSV